MAKLVLAKATSRFYQAIELSFVWWISATSKMWNNSSKYAAPTWRDEMTMHYALITKTLGVLLMIFSFTMAPPALLAWYYEDGGELPFASAFAVIFLLGLALWLPVWNRRGELRTRDGFLIVTLFWAVLGSIGS